jgi:hypothetical protein
MSKSHQEYGIDSIHPAGFFCEDVDDQLLVLRFPTFVFWMRVNDRLDIVFNVIILSSLVMKGNMAENQGIEDTLDISLGSACDTNAQIRELQFDELLYEG